MHKLFKHFVIASFLVGGLAHAQKHTEYITGKFDVDNAHTRVSFVIPHFVISEVEGRFNEVKGTFTLAQPFTKSSVTATIPVASIDTGIKQRDDHLRSKDFFEVEKFPEMKLVSRSIKGTPESFQMVAAVTIKGVTKNVTFDGKYTGNAVDSWGKQRVGLQMTGKVNRKDFKINYDDKIDIGPAVGNEVQLRIWTEGVLAEAPKK